MKFDTYTLQARILPTIIFMLPFFIEANYIISLFSYQIAISATIANLILFVFLTLFANWTRYFGRKREKKLFAKWDGAPTIRFLRSDNDEYNKYKREEIKKYLKMMFNNIKMPTEKEEKSNRDVSDKKYEVYISNLRTLTRDSKKFKLLHSENRNYGMWRNLYGLKIMSIIFISMIFSLNLLLAFLLPAIMNWINCIILNSILAILCLIWCCIVTQSKIKDVAECYARQLLDTVIILKDKNFNNEIK